MNRVIQTTTFADDIKALIAVFARRFYVFFPVFILTLLPGLWYVQTLNPYYTSTAMILLDPSASELAREQIGQRSDPSPTLVETETRIIKSPRVLYRAYQTLNPDAPVEAETGATPPVSVALSDDASIAQILDPLGAALPEEERAKVTRLARNLEVEREGLTFAINVRYTAGNAVEAARVANAVASAYLAEKVGERTSVAQYENAWLESRVEELRLEVEAAERAVADYQSEAGVVLAKGSTSTENQLVAVETALSDAREELRAISAQIRAYNAARAAGDGTAASDVVDSPLMQGLRERRTDLSASLAQLATSLGPRHPEIVELRSEIASVNEQIQAELQRHISDLTNQQSVLQARIRSLETSRQDFQTDRVRENEAQVQIAQLETRAESLRTLYENLLSRFQQSTTFESFYGTTARILSPAQISLSPAGPNREAYMLVITIIASVLAAAAVMLSEIFANAVFREDALERETDLPVLSAVPKLYPNSRGPDGSRVQPEFKVHQNPNSRFAEVFRNLLVILRQRYADTASKSASIRRALLDEETPQSTAQRSLVKPNALIVQFTSPLPGEGKTLSAISFAQAAAQSGLRVLLIDGDLHRRSLTMRLSGDQFEHGLSDYLADEMSIDEALYGSEELGLDILPAAKVARDARSLKRLELQPGLRRLFSQVSTRYDVIVVDSPPVLAVSDALAIALEVSSVVLVTRWGRTPLSAAQKAAEELRRVNAPVTGTLLSGISRRAYRSFQYGGSRNRQIELYYSTS